MHRQQIEIRSCEPDDFRAIREIHLQPKAIWGTLQLPFASVEMWKKRLADRPDGLYSFVACVDGKVVGSLGLSALARSPRRQHVGELGIVIHDQWQGQGIGSALMDAATNLADRWLNLTRLELTVYIDNRPAIKLYEKVGFEVEGTLRQYAFRDGEFVDAYAMARVR
jgi:putative acetyltransferase